MQFQKEKLLWCKMGGLDYTYREAMQLASKLAKIPIIKKARIWKIPHHDAYRVYIRK